MKRSCKSCGTPWKADPVESEWARSKNTAVPRVCASCRASGRGLTNTTLPCTKCEQTFSWPKELALYASMFGWTDPHRCPNGCTGDLEEIGRFRGDMQAIAPVWMRAVKGVDIEADPSAGPTEEEKARAAYVPKLDELFKGLGSGMSVGGFGDLPPRTPAPVEPVPHDDLPPEILPSPDSLFSFGKKS